MHLGIDHDLVAGAQDEHVVEHDLADGDLDGVPVTTHPGAIGAETHGELLEGALRPDLLQDADEPRWR
jgi:hypothetical protein